MACTTKSSKGKDKNSVNEIEVKKSVTNKVTTTTTKTNQKSTKANLERGKLPLNWNKFIDAELTKSSLKKYPKSLAAQSLTQNAITPGKLVKKMGAYNSNTTERCVAIDCEMVGIGLDGRGNMLARVSIVDGAGTVVYDTFVMAQEPVVDYRTAISGVRPIDMEQGREFRQVQKDVATIIAGKLLIGHAIRHDLKVLYLSHPRKYIRDTSKYKKFRAETDGRTPSLKFLSSSLLGMSIQHGEHSSVIDARAAMLLYMKVRNEWENEVRCRHGNK